MVARQDRAAARWGPLEALWHYRPPSSSAGTAAAPPKHPPCILVPLREGVELVLDGTDRARWALRGEAGWHCHLPSGAWKARHATALLVVVSSGTIEQMPRGVLTPSIILEENCEEM